MSRESGISVIACGVITCPTCGDCASPRCHVTFVLSPPVGIIGQVLLMSPHLGGVLGICTTSLSDAVRAPVLGIMRVTLADARRFPEIELPNDFMVTSPCRRGPHLRIVGIVSLGSGRKQPRQDRYT